MNNGRLRVSNIDPTKPVFGTPTTESVRDNFAITQTEISALQNLAVGGPFLPLTGGTLVAPGNVQTPGWLAATDVYVNDRLGNPNDRWLFYSQQGVLGFWAEALGARFTLNRDGDAVFSRTVTCADPTDPWHAATRGWVTGLVGTAEFLPLTGGTLTGQLTAPRLNIVGGTAAAALLEQRNPVRVWETGVDPAGNWGVSDMTAGGLRFAINTAGDAAFVGTVGGAEPTAAGHFATRGYVDAFVPDLSAYLELAGGTMQGPLLLARNPVLQEEASTRAYTDARVLRSGDTFGGILDMDGNPLVGLPAPTAPDHAVNRFYIDNLIGSLIHYQGVWSVAANNPDLTQLTPTGGDYYLAETQDPLVPELADPAIPGIGGRLINHHDLIIYAAVLGEWQDITGAGTIPEAPVDSAYYARRNAGWVDIEDAFLPLSGGTIYRPNFTDPLVIEADQGHSARIHYVLRPGQPTDPVPAGIRWQAGVRQLDGAFVVTVPGIGATHFLIDPAGLVAVSGNLLLGLAPTEAMHAVTRAYADSLVAGGPFLPLTGGTVTGDLDALRVNIATETWFADRSATPPDPGRFALYADSDALGYGLRFWHNGDRLILLADGRVLLNTGGRLVTMPGTGGVHVQTSAGGIEELRVDNAFVANNTGPQLHGQISFFGTVVTPISISYATVGTPLTLNTGHDCYINWNAPGQNWLVGPQYADAADPFQRGFIFYHGGYWLSLATNGRAQFEGDRVRIWNGNWPRLVLSNTADSLTYAIGVGGSQLRLGLAVGGDDHLPRDDILLDPLGLTFGGGLDAIFLKTRRLDLRPREVGADVGINIFAYNEHAHIYFEGGGNPNKRWSIGSNNLGAFSISDQTPGATPRPLFGVRPDGTCDFFDRVHVPIGIQYRGVGSLIGFSYGGGFLQVFTDGSYVGQVQLQAIGQEQDLAARIEELAAQIAQLRGRLDNGR